MSSQQCFVFRINYEDSQAHEWLIEELFRGRLRQGWGYRELNLLQPDGSTRDKADWVQAFSERWGEKEASKRHAILSRMCEMREGDFVVIPKTRNFQTLTIAKVNRRYAFDATSETHWGDFRHCIEVEQMRSYAYDSCAEAKLVSAKFVAYQSAVNMVRASKFIDNVRDLHKKEDNFKSHTIRQLSLEIRHNALKPIAKNLLALSPIDFENLVAECLKSKGYIITAMHQYDGNGADADIVATYPLPLLTESCDLSPTILIQVKKKDGPDEDDIKGIKQLIQAREYREAAYCVLMNTADTISTKARDLATANNIKIIPPEQIVEFLVTCDLTA